ncbi:uncharacterized protein MONBRDRAFT_32968, partial [Monosiga brevicollis MX1]
MKAFASTRRMRPAGQSPSLLPRSKARRSRASFKARMLRRPCFSVTPSPIRMMTTLPLTARASSRAKCSCLSSHWPVSFFPPVVLVRSPCPDPNPVKYTAFIFYAVGACFCLPSSFQWPIGPFPWLSGLPSSSSALLPTCGQVLGAVVNRILV